MSEYNGIYLDDEPSQAKTYSKLMSFKGDDALSVTYLDIDEIGELSTKVFESEPDLVIIDFRLDENIQAIDPKKSYKGSTFAQQLRDKAVDSPLKDFPIVLLSAEDKREQFRVDSTAHDLFDSTHTKEEVGSEEHLWDVRYMLFSLCDGYKLLKSVWDGDRLSIFGLDGDERDVVSVQELRQLLESATAPHNAARIILRDAIHRTGLLLSDDDIAARLGVNLLEIELDSLLRENGLAYDGIFSLGWDRWWAHRFEDWSEEFFGTRPTRLSGAERVAIIKEKTGLELEAATSQWNKSPDELFAFACASCGFPTEVKHSLSAFDPRVPVYGQQKRICWDCIATDEYLAKNLQVQDTDVPLVEKIKTMDRG